MDLVKLAQKLEDKGHHDLSDRMERIAFVGAPFWQLAEEGFKKLIRKIPRHLRESDDATKFLHNIWKNEPDMSPKRAEDLLNQYRANPQGKSVFGPPSPAIPEVPSSEKRLYTDAPFDPENLGQKNHPEGVAAGGLPAAGGVARQKKMWPWLAGGAAAAGAAVGAGALYNRPGEGEPQGWQYPPPPEGYPDIPHNLQTPYGPDTPWIQQQQELARQTGGTPGFIPQSDVMGMGSLMEDWPQIQAERARLQAEGQQKLQTQRTQEEARGRAFEDERVRWDQFQSDRGAGNIPQDMSFRDWGSFNARRQAADERKIKDSVAGKLGLSQDWFSPV